MPSLALDSVLLGEVPDQTRHELEQGRLGTEIAVEQILALQAQGEKAIYLVPPILRGGARDYEAARRVLEAVRE